jgi:hypothetical protein
MLIPPMSEKAGKNHEINEIGKPKDPYMQSPMDFLIPRRLSAYSGTHLRCVEPMQARLFIRSRFGSQKSRRRILQ